jgi:flagellar biosynthesis/type III secretory pathway chaperone
VDTDNEACKVNRKPLKSPEDNAMEDLVYINILIDTLQKKSGLLDELISITSEQEVIISDPSVDMDKLDETFSVKESIIQQLNQLDEGFEKVYSHIRDFLAHKKELYKDKILKLQELIREVTEKSTMLQAQELRNRNKLQDYFSVKKKEIKEFRVSSKKAASYYKNTASGQSPQSFFFDTKN